MSCWSSLRTTLLIRQTYRPLDRCPRSEVEGEVEVEGEGVLGPYRKRGSSRPGTVPAHRRWTFVGPPVWLDIQSNTLHRMRTWKRRSLRLCRYRSFRRQEVGSCHRLREQDSLKQWHRCQRR